MALSMNGEQSTESADRTDSADAIYAQSFEAVPGDSAAAIYLAMLQEVEN